MDILRIDHPDILDFIALKQTPTKMTNFNLSVGITDSLLNHLARRHNSSTKLTPLGDDDKYFHRLAYV